MMRSIAFVALVLVGCAGDDAPGGGPSVRTSVEHAALVGPTLAAIDHAGDALMAEGLADPALVVDVTLLDGQAFSVMGPQDVLDGAPLWGLNELVITSHGVRCRITVALRNADGADLAPEDYRPSQTSLVHELAHCGLVFALRPDSRHQDRDVWDRIVPSVNAQLAEAGL